MSPTRSASRASRRHARRARELPAARGAAPARAARRWSRHSRRAPAGPARRTVGYRSIGKASPVHGGSGRRRKPLGGLAFVLSATAAVADQTNDGGADRHHRLAGRVELDRHRRRSVERIEKGMACRQRGADRAAAVGRIAGIHHQRDLADADRLPVETAGRSGADGDDLDRPRGAGAGERIAPLPARPAVDRAGAIAQPGDIIPGVGTAGIDRRVDGRSIGRRLDDDRRRRIGHRRGGRVGRRRHRGGLRLRRRGRGLRRGQEQPGDAIAARGQRDRRQHHRQAHAQARPLPHQCGRRIADRALHVHSALNAAASIATGFTLALSLTEMS
ncbi:hypothetical protein Swit_0868 [Rhizorhabdus wittichii RW1]|uniref:Uncharacterized protein n=1 Tax=Rhizorhabdus wittichii (strain DSM 6014 / CCUG 31198 / JCM 15750 / NBRC 105917 / EY 4224 / RW1) TaxID=392499 RepID=A0A9J9LCW0_RHIWR|nr:hypothetical protein Swit_0868 [Rhizorhabdus wittichii RW1]